MNETEQAVVRWLRRIDTVFAGLPVPFKSFSDVADAIERGEYKEATDA